MTTDTLDDGLFDDTSNVLVLAPLTPAGNGTFFELLTAVSDPAETNVAAITYTQPPTTWVEDWQRQVGDLPASLAFIHANGAQVAGAGADVPVALEETSISKVNPREPMDIIAPLTEMLTRWRGNGRQTVVSVQTLSVLLEYVDFDTAFRYLHVVTYRVQTNAIGFYQMDPDLHDAETVNTLKALFDAVVEFDGDGWRVTETYRTDASVARDRQRHDASGVGFENGEGMLGAISNVLDRFSGSGEAQRGKGGATNAAESDTNTGTASAPMPDIDTTDANVLTDEERVFQLLSEYGGRMKQTDVTEETSWSKATVSRKLSAMEADGLISRSRVGRENVVFLAGYEPTANRSIQR